MQIFPCFLYSHISFSNLKMKINFSFEYCKKNSLFLGEVSWVLAVHLYQDNKSFDLEWMLLTKKLAVLISQGIQKLVKAHFLKF